MEERGGRFARRVLLADARGGDRFLRVTWHPEGGQFVISHWQGDVCEAATRVRIDDIAELLALFANALATTTVVPAVVVFDETG